MKPIFSTSILLLFLVVFTQCSDGIDKTIQYTSTNENEVFIEFQQLANKHKTRITNKEERAESILLCLTFVNKVDSTTFQNQIVGFYQSVNSEILGMDKPSEDYAINTNGLAITDDNGRLLIEYKLLKDNNFVSLEIFEAHPKSVSIKFKQHLTQRGIDFTLKSNEHFLADIKKTKEGKLVCFLTINVNDSHINAKQ